MINKKDLKVMAYLRQDSRMKLTKMSRLARLPVSTIFDRMRQHEGGLIKKNVCLLDFAGLGFHTRANLMLSIGKKDKENVKEHLQNCNNVNSIYKINNGFDYLAEVVFKNITDLEKFINIIEDKYDVKKKEVHYIIDDIKREMFMSNPQTIELLEIA